MAPVLQLTNFSLSVGSTQLLDGVSALVTPGQRIALTGPNGCGKSTLLRALAFQDGTDYFLVGAGGISLHVCDENGEGNGVLLVEQDDLQWSRLLPGAELDESELRELTVPDALDLATSSGDDASLEDVEIWRRLTISAHDVLGWSVARYDEVPITQLSLGSAVRAYLAIALHRRDIKLLLLDEPTNHLDLPSIVWLQQSLIASGKTVIFVSHDVEFLDGVADHLWVIDSQQRKLTVSGTKYSAFMATKALHREQQRLAFDAQQKRHKKLSVAADKLRAQSTAGSRHMGTDNDKLQRDFRRDRAGRSGKKAKSIETLRDSEEKIERVVDRQPLRINLDASKLQGPEASLMLDSVKLGHGGVALMLPDVSLRVDFGERLAIIGINGVGKSTLLRTLMREIDPVSGEVFVGRDLMIGNLTQEHSSLPRDVSAREHVASLTGQPPLHTGKRLISFGLTLQQVDCPMGELNPGARARTALAIFAMRGVSALVLDEPTNHLDEEAIDEVIATLNTYQGTVLVVSHNQQFLRSLQLTRTLALTSEGLYEVESFDDFMSTTVQAASAVVAASFA
eukprot:TRINITY_DN7240_c0_g2_i1.p1 TRINITY_DN7240_c0_g2~~TRINITY_DN7240_c0_g2_i1.p1  ORF type:complete len:567 (-),score=120.87 TRINITY_DN7240_c0_g2_i1:2-1702(-)